MLFMVIEHFKRGDPTPIGQRFKRDGRMLPVGVSYHASWIDSDGGRGFQLMEAADRELLDEWVQHWNDLIDFEIIPVVVSSEFWTS
jgi:hypothetical protein